MVAWVSPQRRSATRVTSPAHRRRRRFRNQSNRASLNHLLRGVLEWRFTSKPAAFEIKAPFPGFIEPALATWSRRCRLERKKVARDA
jgi:hypothetical protein